MASAKSKLEEIFKTGGVYIAFIDTVKIPY